MLTALSILYMLVGFVALGAMLRVDNEPSTLALVAVTFFWPAILCAAIGAAIARRLEGK